MKHEDQKGYTSSSELTTGVYKRWSLKVVPMVTASQAKVQYFGKVVAYGCWSVMRGDRRGRKHQQQQALFLPFPKKNNSSINVNVVVGKRAFMTYM